MTSQWGIIHNNISEQLARKRQQSEEKDKAISTKHITNFFRRLFNMDFIDYQKEMESIIHHVVKKYRDVFSTLQTRYWGEVHRKQIALQTENESYLASKMVDIKRDIQNNGQNKAQHEETIRQLRSMEGILKNHLLDAIQERYNAEYSNMKSVVSKCTHRMTNALEREIIGRAFSMRQDQEEEQKSLKSERDDIGNCAMSAIPVKVELDVKETVNKIRESMENEIMEENEKMLREKMARKEKNLEKILRQQMIEEIKRKEEQMIDELNSQIKERENLYHLSRNTEFHYREATSGPQAKDYFQLHNDNTVNITEIQLSNEKMANIEQMVCNEVLEYRNRLFEKNEFEKRQKTDEFNKEVLDIKNQQIRSLARQRELLKLQSEVRLKEFERLLRAEGKQNVREQVELDLAVLEKRIRNDREVKIRENIEKERQLPPSSSVSSKKRSRLQRFLDFICCRGRQSISVVTSTIKQK